MKGSSSRGSKVTSHTIQYIDYGSTASVTTSQLKKLPAQYWKIPIQAIACTVSLHNDDEYMVSVDDCQISHDPYHYRANNLCMISLLD